MPTAKKPTIKTEPVKEVEAPELNPEVTFLGNGAVWHSGRGRLVATFSKPEPLRNQITGETNKGEFTTSDTEIKAYLRSQGYQEK